MQKKNKIISRVLVLVCCFALLLALLVVPSSASANTNGAPTTIYTQSPYAPISVGYGTLFGYRIMPTNYTWAIPTTNNEQLNSTSYTWFRAGAKYVDNTRTYFNNGSLQFDVVPDYTAINGSAIPEAMFNYGAFTYDIVRSANFGRYSYVAYDSAPSSMQARVECRLFTADYRYASFGYNIECYDEAVAGTEAYAYFFLSDHFNFVRSLYPDLFSDNTISVRSMEIHILPLSDPDLLEFDPDASISSFGGFAEPVSYIPEDLLVLGDPIYKQVINTRNFSDLLDWLGDVMESVLTTQLFVVGNISVTPAILLSTIVGVLLIFMVLRFFAGG